MKILVAYDGRSHSYHAVDSAADLAGGHDAEVTVLSVVPPDARASKAGGNVGLRPHAHEDVARAHARLRERGIASEMRIEHGDPAEEIVRVAGEEGFDLVVSGSRGRGTLGGLLLGSVSQTLVRTAPCPVLVVAEDHEERFEPARS